MDTLDRLEQYFRELEEKDAYSGVVLITQGDRQLFAGAYGYANRAWKIKNSLEIRFDTASITKLFTAVAVLQLIERGLLSFETRVFESLGLEDTAISPQVNVYHLLTHTSGIADDAEEEDGESYEKIWRDKPNYSVTRTVDFLPQFIHKPANFEPGQGCRYNNCGYVLLGLLVEKVTGVEYRDYVRQNVFQRAGMLDSDFLHLGQVNEKVAEGCDPIRDSDGMLTGWKRNIYSFPPIGSPDSGAHVTAPDLDRFLRAVKAGVLLSHELSEAFFTPQVLYRQLQGVDMKYGFGLWFDVDRSGEIICCQKEGVNAGVSGLIRRYPSKDINLLLLCNMEQGVWEPVKVIHAMLVG